MTRLFRGSSTLVLFTCALLGGFACNAFQARADSGTETVLYTFQGGADGAEPRGALLRDSSGALYGTTLRGGSVAGCNGIGCGTIFMVAPPASGSTTWSYTTLYALNGPVDGAAPQAGLVMDSGGNLYGTTRVGGSTACGGYGCGSVFELLAPTTPGGAWQFQTLHVFGGPDGAFPEAEVTLDASGKVFGTTTRGGSADQGSVFVLSPGTGGSATWTEQTIWTFSGGTDGGVAAGPVTLDASGNLYGTALYGGSTGAGVVFELTQTGPSPASYTQNVIYNLPGNQGGGYPRSNLTFDPSGVLYGVASPVAFSLAPQGGGVWSATVIHAFATLADANTPFAGLSPFIFPGASDFFGTGGFGTSTASGAVYKLIAPSDANPSWQSSLLYSFTGGADGANPFGGVAVQKGGLVFGTTAFGGNTAACEIGCGVVYQVTP